MGTQIIGESCKIYSQTKGRIVAELRHFKKNTSAYIKQKFYQLRTTIIFMTFGTIITNHLFNTWALFFGFAITSIACYYGFKTSGGAYGVGKASALTVVISCVSLIILNFLLTIILTQINNLL